MSTGLENVSASEIRAMARKNATSWYDSKVTEKDEKEILQRISNPLYQAEVHNCLNELYGSDKIIDRFHQDLLVLNEPYGFTNDLSRQSNLPAVDHWNPENYNAIPKTPSALNADVDKVASAIVPAANRDDSFGLTLTSVASKETKPYGLSRFLEENKQYSSGENLSL